MNPETVTRDQALDAARQILAATAADKAQADRHGGNPDHDAAHAAALDLQQLVRNTREDS
ncbi:hypothetical protein J3A78_002378 [Streptomyces sp. PvR006]|uniref:hypothetical protein n=1 Tax=Streptomyces sp. PvR006 TaxID=2817860 RepID=UPI001AE886A1|nr:hypothetical protein [Streptomyces sp. PvR006]MBP2581900.1 hypothetical protein [Streptomyces sp. PvR006]